MKTHKLNFAQKNTSSNSLFSYTSIFFIALICLNTLGMLYAIDSISSTRNNMLYLTQKIETIEDNSTFIKFNDVDEKINSYYRELSDKTDKAIDRILVIVGLLATITTFFGILLAFRAPKDIETRIEENKKLWEKAQNISEEATYQAKIIAALNIDYDGELTNSKRVKNISKIIQEYPEKADAYMYRAFLYDKMSQKVPEDKKKQFLNQAIADYEIAHKLNIDSSSYYNDMGVAYSRLCEYHKAITYYTKAIKIDSEDPAVYTNRGGDYNNIGEYQKALDDFEKALEIDSECYDAYLARSYTYHNLCKTEKDPTKKEYYINLQITDLQNAMEINPEDDTPKELMRKLLHERSEKELKKQFGVHGTQDEIIDNLIASIDEKLGDLQKEEMEYTHAFKQYIDAILPYRVQYLIKNDDTAKTNTVRIISKLFDINSKEIDSQEKEIQSSISKFCKLMNSVAPRLYMDGEKDAAEKLLLLLVRYSEDDQGAALNLAFMKRRCETTYTEKSAIELLNSCINHQSSIWCMNKALCYTDGIDVEVNWYTAIEVLESATEDFYAAFDWWNQISLVGEKENNIAFLLFALSKKYKFEDSISINERIHKAKRDGYEIPDDLYTSKKYDMRGDFPKVSVNPVN